MVEVDIATIDPIQHKPKIFLNMTVRQIIFVIPSVLLGVLMGFLAYKLSPDAMFPMILLGVAPGIAFGFFRPQEMELEKYLMLMYENHFKNPQKRIFKTDTEEEVKFLTMEQRRKQEQAKAKMSKVTGQKKKVNKKSQKGEDDGSV